MVSSSTVINIPGGIPNAVPQGKYTIVGIDVDTTGRRLIDEIVQLAAYTPNDHFEQYIMPYMNLNPAARQRHQVRVISIGFYRMLKSMQTYKIIKSKAEIVVIKDFLDWLEQVKAKDINSQGIIMVYHEERKFIPYMILESLKKYNLLDRFANTVKSFANGLNLARSTLSENMHQFSLRKLYRTLVQSSGNTALNSSGGGGSSGSCDVSSATVNVGDNNNNIINNNNINNNINNATNNTAAVNKTSNGSIASQTPSASGGDSNKQQQQQHHHQVRSSHQSHQQLQDRELFDGNASVRAKLAFEVAFQLSNRDKQNDNSSSEKLLQSILKYAQPIEEDLKELETQNQNLERQNSFRPIFLNYFKTTLYHRVRAVKFRIILAEQGYDLHTLNAVWDEKTKAGIVEILQSIDELKPDDKIELADLFDSFFDPSKTTIKPIVKNNNRRRNRRGPARSNRNDDNLNTRSSNPEQGAGGDKQNGAANGVPLSPDSTTNAAAAQGSGNNAGGGGGAAGQNKLGQSGSGNNNNNNGSKPQRNRRNQRSRNNSVKNQSSSVNIPVATTTTTTGVVAVAPVAVPMVATN